MAHVRNSLRRILRVYRPIAGLAVAALIALIYAWQSSDDDLIVHTLEVDQRLVTMVMSKGDNAHRSLPDNLSASTVAELVAAVQETADTGLHTVWISTSDFATSKKQLRADIEAATSGPQRRHALRSLVPVFADPCYPRGPASEGSAPAGDPGFQQLMDDLIYAADNFGAIGWLSGAPCNGYGEASLLAAARSEFAKR